MTTPYTPETHTPYQRACHTPTTLDLALYHASCLAGGWYCRPVTIGIQIIDAADGSHEVYTLFPADALVPEGYTRVYTVTAHRDDANA